MADPPLQETLPTAGPPFLTAPAGVPFSTGSMFRERRFSWLLIARKVNSRQAFSLGPNNVLGTPLAEDSTPPVPGPYVPDDVLDDFGNNRGADLISGTADDPNKPGRDMISNFAV